MPQLLLTILLIAIGWALIIRPQQARVRDQRAMVAALREGDRVITAGGIHGRITALAAETVGIEVAPGVEVTLARAAVVRRLDPTDPTTDPSSDPSSDVDLPDDERSGGDRTARPHEPGSGEPQGEIS